MELLETHSDVTAELNRIKEINADLDRDNVELKTNMEKMKKEEKNKCEQIEYYKLKTAKFDIKCKKYKESKQHIRELKEEQARLLNAIKNYLNDILNIVNQLPLNIFINQICPFFTISMILRFRPSCKLYCLTIFLYELNKPIILQTSSRTR